MSKNKNKKYKNKNKTYFGIIKRFAFCVLRLYYVLPATRNFFRQDKEISIRYIKPHKALTINNNIHKI